jgi:hypothetical protein
MGSAVVVAVKVGDFVRFVFGIKCAVSIRYGSQKMEGFQVSGFVGVVPGILIIRCVQRLG